MARAQTEPPAGRSAGEERLHRCVRDLAALHAMPSLCVGRSPAQALEILLDALPTALSCDFVFLAIPGSAAATYATCGGVPVAENDLPAIVEAVARTADVIEVPGLGARHVMEVSVPLGTHRGRLVAGRATPLDPATDRVLVSVAGGIVGTSIETAMLLEAARHKDEFLAMLGHELRNPLAPIVTAVELLGRHPQAQREQRVIERNTRHLARLVDDLLDISRVTRGHVELRREPVPLDTVLERACEIAAPLMAQAGHHVSVGRAPGVVVEGDPVRLAQVFGNLLTNAAKFTPSGGHVEVSVRRTSTGVSVSVRDDGRGLDRSQLGRIFEPFVQIDRQHDALRGGLGLGLAIVSNLVERHGGTIRAESPGPGRGATFTVELPTTAQPVPDVVPAALPTKSRRGVRVMVVDDNADVAELLSLALTLEGFETETALDGRAALDRWRSFAPHAGVLDVGLPEIDGYQLARHLRREHGDAPMLIAATGYGQQRDRLLAADAGFDCHFVKPVRVDELVTVLDRRVRAA